MDRSRSDRDGATFERPRFLGLHVMNWALLLAGVVAVLFGYVLLNRGSVTAAPLLLLLGYLVLIPAGLLAGLRRPDERGRTETGGE
jgi:uncharacterized membrane protein HdeD (DUF308 family)